MDNNNGTLTEQQIERRRDAALLRALSTPHKRQAEMKVGKRAPAQTLASEDGQASSEFREWLDKAYAEQRERIGPLLDLS